jgi:hypothetical protein
MGQVSRPLDGDAKNFGVSGTCAFCTNPSKSYWMGGKTIEVCGECAISVGMALIADAKFPAHGDPDYARLESVLNETEARFWAVIARLAVQRAADEKRKKEEELAEVPF